MNSETPLLSKTLKSPWAIVAIGAVLRAIVVARSARPRAEWDGDPRTYAEILEALRSGQIDPAMWIWPPGFPAAALPLQPVVGTGPALHLVAWGAGVLAIAVLVLCGQRLRLPYSFGAAAVVLAIFPESVLAAARPMPATLAILGSLVAVVGLEATCRGRSIGWAIGGGLAAAGAATLSRPEIALSIPLYGIVALVGRPRAWRAVAIYLVTYVLVMAPYAFAFRSVSGTWGVSIKPHLNILKLQVYEGGADFAERRELWDEFLEPFSDADGRLDPRQIVDAANPAEYFLRFETIGVAVSNFAYAFRRDPLWVNLLWLLGLAGLALGKGPRRERMYGLAFAAPVLSVATLFPPVERYALIAVPALRFGLGCAIDRARAWAPPIPRAAWMIAIAALAAFSAIETERLASGSAWSERYAQFLLAQNAGDQERAEKILREAIRVDPTNPAPHETLGELLQQRGDAQGAFRAFQESVDRGGSPVPLAAMHARAGDAAAAEALIAPLRRSPPRTAEYWSVVGQIAMMKRDWTVAADSFAESIELGGPVDVLTLNRGYALVPAGRIPEALECFREAARSSNPAVRDAALAELAAFEAQQSP